jgi:hypothetical protein
MARFYRFLLIFAGVFNLAAVSASAEQLSYSTYLEAITNGTSFPL